MGTHDCTELCTMLEDGIRKLHDAPLDLYIPDLPWDIVGQHIGITPMFAHLLTTSAGTTTGAAAESLEGVIAGVLDVEAADFLPDVPLTAYGLDSLSAARLVFALRAMVPVTQMQLLGNMTTTELRRRIKTTGPPSQAQQDPVESEPTIHATKARSGPADALEDEKEAMSFLADELSAGFKRLGSRPPAVATVGGGEVVLLTGTTGTLGSAVLAELASSQMVSKIYAFNRPSTAESLEGRQAAALLEHGLDLPSATAAKIIYVEAQLHQEQLGISADLYSEVRGVLRTLWLPLNLWTDYPVGHQYRARRYD
jgi:hypothetical protein